MTRRVKALQMKGIKNYAQALMGVGHLKWEQLWVFYNLNSETAF